MAFMPPLLKTKQYILNPLGMLYNPAKVLLMAFSISFKILAAHSGRLDSHLELHILLKECLKVGPNTQIAEWLHHSMYSLWW